MAGFAQLSSPTSSERLRRYPQVSLYIHDYSWTRLDPHIRRKILALFPKRQDVELGMMASPPGWFATVYAHQYAELGVAGRAAHVNGVLAYPMDVWKEMVASARHNGFSSIAPIMSPNSGQFASYPFDSSHWDYLRLAALIGGGLTTDSPSRFFLEQKPEYRQFVEQELIWAKQHHLHASFIVSPGTSGTNFRAQTDEVVSELQKAGAIPDEFIVENYEPDPKPGYVNIVGGEDQNSTVASVALSIAEKPYLSQK
ncbi:MAG: hypothetical protein ACRYFU_13130 [Janthinobacterium lividum]